MSKPFDGFPEPRANWSKLPHLLIESLPLIKTVSELKVILYVLRHTWGFQEFDDIEAKCITTDEFAKGRKRRDRTRLDGGTGLTAPSIYSGLKQAVEHGFLICYVDNVDLGRVTHYYRLRSTDDGPGITHAIEPGREGTSPWHTLSEETKRAVYARFGGRCAYCEKKSRKWHYDHIVPKSRGGPDDIDNIALACPVCNLAKGARTPDEWGRQPIVYEDDVKTFYMGWSRFFTGSCKEPLHPTEKETLRKKLTKEKKIILEPENTSDPIPESTTEIPEKTGDDLLDKFFGPRPERQPTECKGNAAIPVQAGGGHSPAYQLVDDISRYNDLRHGAGSIPEKERKEWVRHTAEIIERWGGATVEQIRLAWQAWLIEYSWKATTKTGEKVMVNPHYSTFGTDIGPLLVGVREGSITLETLKAKAHEANGGGAHAGNKRRGKGGSRKGQWSPEEIAAANQRASDELGEAA